VEPGPTKRHSRRGTIHTELLLCDVEEVEEILGGSDVMTSVTVACTVSVILVVAVVVMAA
jgi:hypothetical protein